MVSTTDPIRLVDAAPAVKPDLPDNLQSAKDEIEALQAEKTDFAHRHVRADDGAMAAASKDVVLATAAPNAIDVSGNITRDGGATWYGFPGGEDFS